VGVILLKVLLQAFSKINKLGRVLDGLLVVGLEDLVLLQFSTGQADTR